MYGPDNSLDTCFGHLLHFSIKSLHLVPWARQIIQSKDLHWHVHWKKTFYFRIIQFYSAWMYYTYWTFIALGGLKTISNFILKSLPSMKPRVHICRHKWAFMSPKYTSMLPVSSRTNIISIWRKTIEMTCRNCKSVLTRLVKWWQKVLC